LSQPSHLSQPSKPVTPVTSCHKPCHTLVTTINELSPLCSEFPGGISLAEIHDYLKKGNTPDHLVHKIIDMLSQVLIKKDTEEYRQRNLKAEVVNLICDMSGDISVTDCDRMLQLVTKQEKANLRQILHRLCKQNVLKKQGVKAGVYRIVQNDLEEINWLEAETDEFDIELPLELNQLVKIMPKNLIVLAGSPNSGKTGFLLNIVKDNMFKYNINYFSSEMSEGEFKDRITKFGSPSPREWKFKAYNRCANFDDVIKPDDVNIIDFLEIHDEFWKVGGMMRDIYEKLDKGIAIIALQKAKGASAGRGGHATLEKPRLYLNMEPGKITVEKGKNWRYQTVNPNGMSCTFKLVQGCKFIKECDWVRV